MQSNYYYYLLFIICHGRCLNFPISKKLQSFTWHPLMLLVKALYKVCDLTWHKLFLATITHLIMTLDDGSTNLISVSLVVVYF